MRDNQSNIVIEEVIQASMKMTDVPDPELNQKLKAALYQQENNLPHIKYPFGICR